MIPSKLKDYIDQYLGVQPSAEEMAKIMSKIESYGLSNSDQVEVLEYMDQVFSTSQAEIEAMRKLQEAEARAKQVMSEVEAIAQKSKKLKEARKSAEYRTERERDANSEYERELQEKKFTIGKFLKDFGYGYCAVFVIVFAFFLWGNLEYGRGLGVSVVYSLGIAFLIVVPLRWINKMDSKI